VNIDAYDTAVVSNTKYENIRIEAADTSMSALEETDPPTWRTAANQSIIDDTNFTNVASDSQTLVNLRAKSAQYGSNGVHFSNVSGGGHVLARLTRICTRAGALIRSSPASRSTRRTACRA
jgi:hypothetical protein